MRNSKQQIDNFNKTKKNIIEIINANLNLSQTEIATLLNNSNIRTIRGMKWTNGSVSDFMIIHMGINSKQANFPSVEYKKAIDKIIIDNKDRKLEFIAGVLNKHNLKTVKHKKWTIASVCKYKNQKLNLKLNDSNSILEPDLDTLRFNKNISSQLDKIEPKVMPEPEIKQTKSLIINELTPNDYDTKDLIRDIDGKLFTSSIVISTVFDKERKHINESIRKIIALNNDFGQSNFRPSFYQNKQNKETDVYLISKDGFMLLAMGFTGQKAFDFKLQFINKFNEMEKTLRDAYQKQQKDLIPKELSAMELMAITLKGFQEQETKVLFEIKKESESIKHETNQVLEKQKIEFDKQFKALDERISNIPVYEVKKVYTQEPIKFNSKGLKDTNNTFKTKGDDVINIRKSISNSIKEYDSMRIKQKQKVYTEVYNYMIGIDKTLPEDFYKQYESFISQYGYIAMLDFVFKLGKQKEMQRAIETLKTKLGE